MAHVDDVYLRHILGAIQRINQYLKGIDEGEFFENLLVQDAVIRQLEIIGEATRQISSQLRKKHPNIP